MKTFKYISIIVAIVFYIGLASSCSRSDDGIKFGNSYIRGFVNPEVGYTSLSHIYRMYVDESNKTICDNGYYNSLEAVDVDKGAGVLMFLMGDDSFSEYDTDATQLETYYHTVQSIGDTRYKGPLIALTYNPYALLQTITGFEITCDKTYDPEHPAGSTANDLFDCYYMNLYKFVQDDYIPESGSYRYSWSDENNFPQSFIRARPDKSDLIGKPYINYFFQFILLKAPVETGIYTFTFKISLSNGTIIEENLEMNLLSRSE